MLASKFLHQNTTEAKIFVSMAQDPLSFPSRVRRHLPPLSNRTFSKEHSTIRHPFLRRILSSAAGGDRETPAAP